MSQSDPVRTPPVRPCGSDAAWPLHARRRAGVRLPDRRRLPVRRRDSRAIAGDLGERIVAYVQELGRIEGVVVRARGRLVRRRIAGSFEPGCKSWRRKLTASRSGKRRDRPSGAARSASISIKSARSCGYRTGREFAAGLIDVSSGGAALEVDVAPPVGAAVTVGERRAHVSRHFAGGIAVTFDQDQPARASTRSRPLGRAGRAVDGSQTDLGQRPLTAYRSPGQAVADSALAASRAAAIPPRPEREAS